jgi:hypothetical protein
MAITLRARRHNYDNVSVGNATGTERTIAGSAPPAQVNGAGSNIIVGSAHPTAVVSDNQQVGVTTMAGERLGA